MKFEMSTALSVLERTPAVLKTLLEGLEDGWTMSNEGPDTFSPYDVIGHLIEGEETDWPSRVQLILEEGTGKVFDSYDRFAMYEKSKGKSLSELLEEFGQLRKRSVRWLRSLQLTEADLDKKGVHPKFGEVTLRELLSTWVIHDLSHLAQVSRVMAKQYKEEMGPWLAYIRLMNY